jgi:hypothetical protein
MFSDKDLALEDGGIDLDLIEPAGVECGPARWKAMRGLGGGIGGRFEITSAPATKHSEPP